jgi:hypothetical protein
MKRSFPVLLAVLFLAGCSVSRHAAVPRTATCGVDPKAQPSAAAEASREAADVAADAEQGARVGHRVGVVAGFIAAIFGGGESESIEESVDRYRRTRDAITVAGAVIGAASGAAGQAEPAVAACEQFDELLKIDGIEASRPAPDRIELRSAAYPSAETIAAIAPLIEGWNIEIEAAGDAPLELRDALIRRGIPPSSINARRIDGQTGVVIRLRLDV